MKPERGKSCNSSVANDPNVGGVNTRRLYELQGFSEEPSNYSVGESGGVSSPVGSLPTKSSERRRARDAIKGYHGRVPGVWPGGRRS